ncbi:MAG: hypothetical protein J5916_05305, partial [Oscillospiraceae bacterium]|nr:hypothetical protein [Oscillospiraceae bacterium]
MMTGMHVLFPIFHGPLTKRFILLIPTGGEEQPESHPTQKGKTMRRTIAMLLAVMMLFALAATQA